MVDRSDQWTPYTIARERWQNIHEYASHGGTEIRDEVEVVSTMSASMLVMLVSLNECWCRGNITEGKQYTSQVHTLVGVNWL